MRPRVKDQLAVMTKHLRLTLLDGAIAFQGLSSAVHLQSSLKWPINLLWSNGACPKEYRRRQLDLKAPF